MAITSLAAFIDALRNARILPPQQMDEVLRMQPRFAEPRALAKELLTRDWLTPYQVNQLFQNKGKDLVLGSYVLMERLGQGAMGLVYKARHLTMGRTVAIKVIKKDRLLHPNAIKRFQREIRAMAQLSHPNVVTCYDADQVNGSHFYAMEYVDGVDLGKLIRTSGALAIVPACHYIRQVALCLQYVFERGLVHRDIKPSNILLTPAPKPGLNKLGQIKVLDLGLARIQETDDDSSAITQEGFVVGTADFIAPEQARDSRSADIRSDLYSLGCTFFYILAGRVPFTAKGLQQKLLQHISDPPPAIEMVRPEVPAAVSVVIRRLMAKKPADRHQTPAELADDLAHILTTGGLPERSASRVFR